MTIAMPAGADARAYPVIDRLFARHGYADLRESDFAAFAQRCGAAMLVFIEDPGRFKETLDLAVIVPEIARAFPGRFAIGVLLPEAARAAAPRYGVRRWPALVLLRDGEYVGAVEGLRNWDEYLTEVGRLLEGAAVRPPGVGIAVKTAPGNGGRDVA
jgi:hydrogenase-1 operon protein HyaE